MQNYRFDHVHLYARDPVKTAEFYVKVFGAERRGIRRGSERHTVVELALNGVKIIVSTPWEDDAQTRYGLDHFGLETDNLDAAIAGLKASGIRFMLDKTAVPTADISFLIAPDDTLVEVIETKGQERSGSHGEDFE